MKKLSILLVLVFCSFAVLAQIVVEKTNTIKLDLTQNTNTILPKVSWEYPALEYSNSPENKIMVKGYADSKIKLKSVKLSLTNATQSSEPMTKEFPVEEPGFNVNIESELYLIEGENKLEIIAENVEGGVTSESRTIFVGMDAISDAVLIDRKDHALLFATDKYDYWNDLVNPVYDASSIAKELEDRYGFTVEIVKDATKDEVFVKLREYAQKEYKPHDQLLIFFAGHGNYDEVLGEGFVVAKNSLRNDPGKTSYVSHNRLRSNINNIPCEHVFLVMDVCFGGTFDPILAGRRGNAYDETDNREYLVKKLSKTTRKYLTSGSKEYVSDGVRGEHSPFAKQFIESLKTNGGEDRILIVDEIRLFMERLKSTPRFDGFGSDETGSDFVFVAK